MEYQKILDWLEELYDEMAGFSKERKWFALRDEINQFKEWMLVGMVDECPIEFERWLTEEQLAELEE